MASFQYSFQFTITVRQRNINEHAVTTVSLSPDSQLLIVAQYGQKQFFIYNNGGRYVSNISVPSNAALHDVVWTPHGDRIVVTAAYDKSLWVMSVAGKVISKIKELQNVRDLSVSPDGILYVVDYYRGILESADYGMTWRLLIKKPPDILTYIHAIKVSTNKQTYDIWTIAYMNTRIHTTIVRIYTVHNRSDKTPTWRNLTLPTNLSLNSFSRLAFDGDSHVYVTKTGAGVHVLTVTGQYVQLLQSSGTRRSSYGIAVDRQRHVLYVGQTEGIVSVFTRR